MLSLTNIGKRAVERDYAQIVICGRSNTMAKAILELEMPESCWGCPLQAISTEKISTEKKIRHCTVIGYLTEYYGTKRRENCPLKLVEGKEGE